MKTMYVQLWTMVVKYCPISLKPKTKWIMHLLYKTELNSTTAGLVSLHQLMDTIWLQNGHQLRYDGK